MAKVLFIIAKNGFRDEELLIPAEILSQAGHQIFIASNTEAGNFAYGAGGSKVKVDLNLNEVNPSDYDLVVFVGGPGALDNLNNEVSYQIARKAVLKKLAAICIAPTILALAGVLKGKKATVWSSSQYKESINILKENGAEYQEKSVVVDGNIITANGPAAAKEFGEKLKEILMEE